MLLIDTKCTPLKRSSLMSLDAAAFALVAPGYTLYPGVDYRPATVPLPKVLATTNWLFPLFHKHSAGHCECMQPFIDTQRVSKPLTTANVVTA